ncbi:hypothetical protein ACQPZJ_01710 [Actinoplanes sp. CA-054009]
MTDPEAHRYQPDPDRPPPRRPSPERVARYRALAEWQAEWTAKWADRAGFKPGEHPKPDSDYSLHHVLLDAPPEAQREFYERADEIMGIRRRRSS